jgi:DNA-directed RNA polymerase
MNNRQVQHEIELARLHTNRIINDLRTAQDRKNASNTSFGRDLIVTFIPSFAEAIVEASKKKARGKATTSALSLGYKKIHDLLWYLADPQILAYVSLTKIIDCTYVSKTNEPKVIEAAKIVGRALEDQMRTVWYLTQSTEDVAQAYKKQINTPHSREDYKRTGAIQTAEKLLMNVHGWSKDELFQNWTSNDRFYVGAFICHVAEQEGIIQSFNKNIGKRKAKHYRLTEPVLAQSLKYQAELEERNEIRHPLVDIPKEWKLEHGPARNNNSGGYYQDWFKVYNLNLCRHFYSDTSFGTDCINLLNTLGRTAWNIDKGILDIASSCLDKGYAVGKLTAVTEDPILRQTMPLDLKDLEKKDPKRIAWRKKKSKAIELHVEQVAKSRPTRTTISLAKEYLKQPRFYLSWSCDYRGRMYPQQSFLTEHSSDFERSLLIFADGCKLDMSGQEYAAQAVGEAYKGSKISYQERAEWTRQNTKFINSIAENPTDFRNEWEQADKPWQFLQLAIEWNKVVITKEKALWNVPISADATSSGLQLLSAIRRDPKGMEFSNLLPPKSSNEPPRDAYREVLRVARELADKDDKNKSLIKYITDEDRKLGKIVLMKVVYGTKEWSNKNEIREYFIEKGLYKNELDHNDVERITKLLRRASKIVFPMAFEALDWIKNLYKKSIENGNQSLTWKTPNLDSINLFKVIQRVKEIKYYAKTSISIPIGEIKEPDFTKMGSSIAPDFVHSLDSCVLKSSFQDWDRPLVLIHDCFKVLPNDFDLAKERIKHGFVHVCKDDPLARLADDLGVTEDQLQRLEQGLGTLEDVLNSSYIFN